jgi:hypothetical protein
MVQNDIEDDEQVLLVGRVHEFAQFDVGGGGIIGETRLRADEVVNAVTVIGAGIKRKILENRTEPDGSSAQLPDVGKLLLHARELSALKPEEVRIVEWLMGGRRGGDC